MQKRCEVLVWQLLLTTLNLGLSIVCLPENLILNGGFDTQPFTLEADGSYKQISKPIKRSGKTQYEDFTMPNWEVLNGSVQVISSKFFSPDPATWSGTGNFCVHLNDPTGPGTIRSAPLLGQLAGAWYNISLAIAGNPSGGELFKALQVTMVLKRKGLSGSPTDFPFVLFNASNPFGSRGSIGWITKTYSYVSNGRESRLQIASKTSGSYGFLIDNVRVSLYSLLENGSFEQLARTNSSQPRAFMDSDTIPSPSWKIRHWYVQSGNVKLIRGRLQPSKDRSPSTIDLNGDTAGLLVGNVSTTLKKLYHITFDYASNPEAGRIVRGYFLFKVSSDLSSSSSILTKWIWVTNKHFSKADVGWKTMSLSFLARSNLTHLQFQSKVAGSYGPLLDNVIMWEYTTPFSAAAHTHLPSLSSLLLLWILVVDPLIARRETSP